MKGIEQYKNRFYNLMESTIGDVKPLINEEIQLNQKEGKINSSPEQLLNNSSTSFNTSIGRKKLPSCYKYDGSKGYGGGFSGEEMDWVIDQLDVPVTNDNVMSLHMYLQGSGISGSWGGSFQNLDISERVVQGKDGLWYPAVEQLRVFYNEDESFETLFSAVSDEEFSGNSDDTYLKGKYDSKSKLIYAYKHWIECVNNESEKTESTKKQKESFSSFEACFAKDNITWVSSKSSVYKNPSNPSKDAMEIKEGNKRTIIYKGQNDWESGPGKTYDYVKETQQTIKWVCDSNGKLTITPDGKVGPMTYD